MKYREKYKCTQKKKKKKQNEREGRRYPWKFKLWLKDYKRNWGDTIVQLNNWIKILPMHWYQDVKVAKLK